MKIKTGCISRRLSILRSEDQQRNACIRDRGRRPSTNDDLDTVSLMAIIVMTPPVQFGLGKMDKFICNMLEKIIQLTLL